MYIHLQAVSNQLIEYAWHADYATTRHKYASTRIAYAGSRRTLAHHHYQITMLNVYILGGQRPYNTAYLFRG